MKKLVEKGYTPAGYYFERYHIGFVAGIEYHTPKQEWLVGNKKELCGHAEHPKVFKTMEQAQKVADKFAKKYECPPIARKYYLTKYFGKKP